MEVEIITKDIFDVESKNSEKMFFDFCGLNSKVKLSKIYDIYCDNNNDYFYKIAQEVLSDPVVEDYIILKQKRSLLSGYNIFVKVSFKKGVSDVVGESVKKIISDIGYFRPYDVRTSKGFYFSLKNKNKIINFIKENYANELINNIEIMEI